MYRSISSIKPETYYLGVSIPFGFLLLFLTPPAQVPDENAHLFRSFQLSEGHVISVKNGNRTGDNLPTALMTFMDRFHPLRFHPENKTTLKDILECNSVRIDPKDQSFVVFSNTAIHPPLTYLPQTFGILLARQFTSSILVLFYVGRSFNLIASIALIYCAIRLTPIGKWMFTFLALTPMMLFLAASLSSDAFTNALSFFIVAHTLHVAYSAQGRVSSANLIVMAILAFAIGQTKQAYFLLPACYLLIPVSTMGTAKRYWLGLFLVMTVTLISVAAWGTVVRGIYSPSNPQAGIDPLRQLLSVRSDPSRFLAGVIDVVRQFPMYLCQYIGVLGWLDTRLPRWLLLAEIAVLVLTFLTDIDSRLKVGARQALVCIAVAFFVWLTVLVVIYATWEPVGSRLINVQGRYFIPLGPLLGLAVAWLQYPLSRLLVLIAPYTRFVTILAVPILLVISLITVYARYFVVGYAG